MNVWVDHRERTVTIFSKYPLPPGVKGKPGYCEHTLDWENTMALIHILMGAAKEIAPNTIKFPNEKTMDVKVGRF